MDSLVSIDSVRQLEELMLQHPQQMIETWDGLHGGMYHRTIFIPQGTLLTGALMNMDNLCIMYGDITVTTDEGVQRFTAVSYTHLTLPTKA